MAVRLARQLDLPSAVQSDLYLAGLLHDIGKIGVRDDVLQKPGRLTPEEFAHIQEHPVIGDRLVGHVKPLLHLRPGVRNHHERLGRRRLPGRFGRRRHPVAGPHPGRGRLVRRHDARPAVPHRPAGLPRRGDAARGAGTQWDPHVVAAFQVCRHDLYTICQRGIGDSVCAAVEQALKAGGAVDNSSRLNSLPARE